MYVSFTQDEYFVSEDELEVEICLELFGVHDPIQSGILIFFFTDSSSALGMSRKAKSDYC